jgi:toxin YoeB
MTVSFVYTPSALRDLKTWKKQHNSSALETIGDIQREIAKNPTAITGRYNPEKLKGDMTGCYSRRITMMDRFVYRPSSTETNVVEVLQCKGHYRLPPTLSFTVHTLPPFRA